MNKYFSVFALKNKKEDNERRQQRLISKKPWRRLCVTYTQNRNNGSRYKNKIGQRRAWEGFSTLGTSKPLPSKMVESGEHRDEPQRKDTEH